MKACYYDLHIHSALSPCSDDLMTLHNIINMASIKGLDFISVTDHNSAKNIPSLMEVAKEKNVIVIPGMEVETVEGIHILCYFESLKNLLLFDKIVYKNIPTLKNKEQIFGKQILFDQEDREIGKETKMLINSTNLKLSELVSLVHRFKGLAFAAHIDRKANSIITVLGFIPEELSIDGLEISKNVLRTHYLENKAYRKYQIIQNSDAHFIGDICEKNNYFCLKEKSIKALFDHLGGGV